MRFKVVLEPSDEGGFTVYVPSLPGCISEGETEEEALKNIQEAIELYHSCSSSSQAIYSGAYLEAGTTGC